MNKGLLILAAAILVIAGVVIGYRGKGHANRPHDLSAAPDFSLTDFSGRPLTLSGLRGKVVLLDLWATWCEPCKAEIPHFIDLQNRYGGQGLQIVGLSMDDDEKAARDFAQQYKMNYPVAMGTSALADKYGGVFGLPITFAIDRQGRLVSRHIGATDPSVFEDEVKKLLAAP